MESGLTIEKQKDRKPAALEEKVKAFLDKIMQEGKPLTLLLALSGGRDSVSLLAALKNLQDQLGYELRAVHVHHGIRKNADMDEVFCRELCESWQIPLDVFHVDVPALAEEKKLSIEEAARILRYECFEEAAKELEAKGETVRVCLAHHQTDQAETVLLHLLRGSGLKGLGGMQEVRGIYLRPMLSVSEEEINAYASAKELTWREDESNADTSFTRNRIRRELLPYLQTSFNPNIVENLCALAETASEDEACLESLVPPVEKGVLKLTDWDTLPPAVQKRTLQAWMRKNGLEKDLLKVHLDALMDLANGASGRRISLPSGLTVYKSYDILSIIGFLSEAAEEKAFGLEYLSWESLKNRFQAPDEIPDLPDEKWLKADDLSGVPVWRKREPGDYLYVGQGRQKLKDFFINRKVPREERDSLMLLADGSHVLWIPGWRVSDAAFVRPDTKTILHIWEVRDV